MKTHRTLRILSLAAALTAGLSTAAFAQTGGQLPTTVPSQEMIPTNGPLQDVPSQEMIQMSPTQQAVPASGVVAPQPVPPAGYRPAAYSAPQRSLSQHPNAPLQAKQEGNVTYISGGIGDAEKEQLKTESPNYNFHMINSDPTGHYTADTSVTIQSRDGREMIRVDNAGPLFYAQLPPGEYKVEASNGSQHETRNVRVSSSGHSEVHMVWR